MGKYTPLAKYLKDLPGNEVSLDFDDIEIIIRASLPPSAHNHREWWANDRSGYHSWATEWMEAGWACDDVSLSEERVRFRRIVPKETPTRADLLAVAAFATEFDAPDFVVGEWSDPYWGADGVEIRDWSSSRTVASWEKALYDHHIVDSHSDYRSDENIGFVNAAVADASLVVDLDLAALRQVLTYLVRAERHTGGGWYEHAFASGMAQAATRRLGEIVEATDDAE